MITADQAIATAQQWESEKAAGPSALVGRALLAHINSLTSPQVTDEQIILLALERMDRARNILTSGNPTPTCNWGMLDTSDLRALLSAPPAAEPLQRQRPSKEWYAQQAQKLGDEPSVIVAACYTDMPAASQEAKPVAADLDDAALEALWDATANRDDRVLAFGRLVAADATQRALKSHPLNQESHA